MLNLAYPITPFLFSVDLNPHNGGPVGLGSMFEIVNTVDHLPNMSSKDFIVPF